MMPRLAWVGLLLFLLVVALAFVDFQVGRVAGSTLGFVFGQVRDEGNPLTIRPYLDFVGAGITCADTTAATECTIPMTDTKCLWFEHPTAVDDFKSFWFAQRAVTLTSLWAESDQTVTFMLQVDDGTPADVDSVDLVPAAGTAEDTALDGDTTMATGDRLDLDLVSVANAPTWVSICWTFTWND